MSDEKMSDVHAALNWAERVDRVHVLNGGGVVPDDLFANLSAPTFVSVPEGRKVEDLTARFDWWRDRPVRAAGYTHANTVQSFIDLTNRYKVDETVVYLDRPEETLIAVINGHLGSTPGFGDLRVGYSFPRSEEMQAWGRACGDVMKQEALGVFLDDHLPDIVNPDKAALPESVSEFLSDTGGVLATRSQMLQLSRDIQVDVTSMTAQRVNLDSGESGLQFSEAHNTSLKGKRIKVPNMFLIAIPVFDGGDRFLIPCRLQYRVSGGQVVFSLSMWRRDKFVREATDIEVEKVTEGLADVPLIEGQAPEESRVRP